MKKKVRFHAELQGDLSLARVRQYSTIARRCLCSCQTWKRKFFQAGIGRIWQSGAVTRKRVFAAALLSFPKTASRYGIDSFGSFFFFGQCISLSPAASRLSRKQYASGWLRSGLVEQEFRALPRLWGVFALAAPMLLIGSPALVLVPLSHEQRFPGRFRSVAPFTKHAAGIWWRYFLLGSFGQPTQAGQPGHCHSWHLVLGPYRNDCLPACGSRGLRGTVGATGRGTGIMTFGSRSGTLPFLRAC